MSNLVKFDFNNHPVRTVNKDSAVWFVAKDICDVLGITNTSDALKSLDEDEKTTIANSDSQAGHGAQSYLAISESGFYKLVFKSRKKIAKDFTKWVTSEVLPAIREKGGYVNPTATNEQIITLISSLREEAYYRALAELECKSLKKQVRNLSRFAIPKAKFGSISPSTGLPRDIIVATYLKSDSRAHKGHGEQYVQLLLPLNELPFNDCKLGM
jgi:prophage antirepressor-like protein